MERGKRNYSGIWWVSKFGPTPELSFGRVATREAVPSFRRNDASRVPLSDDPIREASERIGATIAIALDGKSPAEVVPLREV